MTKFNLEVVYPPPHVWEVWHYKNANTELIRQEINEFNWQRAFLNTNVNEKVDIFNSTILTDPPTFSNNKVSQNFSQNHLGVILDLKLAFKDHLNNVLAKVNEAVGFLRKLRNLLPRANANYYIQSFHLAISRLC